MSWLASYCSLSSSVAACIATSLFRCIGASSGIGDIECNCPLEYLFAGSANAGGDICENDALDSVGEDAIELASDVDMLCDGDEDDLASVLGDAGGVKCRSTCRPRCVCIAEM